MKITNFDEQFGTRLAVGGTTIITGSSGGSNSGYGGDVLGTAGNLSVVGLRDRVSLSSNMGDNTVGSVLTTIQSSPWIATFALPSNSGSVGSNAMTRTSGGDSNTITVAASGTTYKVMVGAANYWDITLTANCTISFTGWPASGHYAEIGVRTTENGTGGYTPTFSGVTWIGGTTPTHTTTASTATEYVFWTDDGGTTVIGGQVGAGGGTTSPLTTKGDLYTYTTTNARFAVGSNGTGLLADSAETTGLRWSRTAPVGELLITDTPAGSPLVFADLIQNEAQDDLVYADL